MVGKCLSRSSDREECKARSIKYQHGITKPAESRTPHDRDTTRKDTHSEVAPVLEGRRGYRTNQHIAHDPSGSAGSDRQRKDAEEIQSIFDPSDATAQGKDECAEQIERSQEGVYEDLLVREMNIHRRLLSYLTAER